jgi:hypothetical protein
VRPDPEAPHKGSPLGGDVDSNPRGVRPAVLGP